ncbi:uncharacterized protein CXorf38 homolog [Chanos chanos]|uniref:Uncharacterized protein CXorf38 homolog n=1 Tax=Chanos chanos TaxID=29144 RepID=A0A6J2VT66_CHACN|nr:uncharacterized protein CXorf38 homolog [Chanos chanos]
MRIMNRFADEGYRNWLKGNEGLRELRARLSSFLENETRNFHECLSVKINTVLHGKTCKANCDIKSWIPKPKKLPALCKVCVPWRDEILDNHSAKGGPIHWNNSVPRLWPTEKWEVAKVYMPRGHRSHNSFKDFDIAALLNLMICCNHFRTFIEAQYILKVMEVRNSVMHSPDNSISKEDLEEHLRKIRNLGQALEPYVPELSTLSEAIDEFSEITDMQPRTSFAILQSARVDSRQRPRTDGEIIRDAEKWALTEKIESIIQRFEDGQRAGLKEEILALDKFLLTSHDLIRHVRPQLKKLSDIAAHFENLYVESVTRHRQTYDELLEEAETSGLLEKISSVCQRFEAGQWTGLKKEIKDILWMPMELALFL